MCTVNYIIALSNSIIELPQCAVYIVTSRAEGGGGGSDPLNPPSRSATGAIRESVDLSISVNMLEPV